MTQGQIAFSNQTHKLTKLGDYSGKQPLHSEIVNRWLRN